VAPGTAQILLKLPTELPEISEGGAVFLFAGV
jgi:hypothetical protein